MGTTAKKIEGHLEQLGGSIKKNIGKAIDNQQMEVEGAAHELKGNAKVEGAKGVERVKGKVEEVAGKVMAKVGELIGDGETEAEGTLREVKGAARQAANRRG